MYIDILTTVLRSFITFVFTLFLARILGRKLISQMTFFDFVVGVSLGSIAASMAMEPKTTSTIAATALIVFSILTLIIGLLHIKSINFRKVIDSEPIVLMDKGSIIEKNMKRIRLTLEELNMKLREKNIFNLTSVD